MGRTKVSMRADSRDAAEVLGNYIRIARIDRGLTIADLANRIGVSAPTVSAIEKGSGSVSIGHVLDAAAVLGVPLFSTDREGRRRLADTTSAMVALLPSRAARSNEVNDALQF